MALRHLFQLLGFFKEAGDYVSPDEDAVAQVGAEGPKHASFHRRIVAISVVLGGVGAALGVGFIFYAAGEKTAQKDATKILAAPLVFAAMGMVLGVSIACLCAPRTFLTGPVGQKWMQLIGTQSTSVARAVCLVITMLLLAFIALMVWAGWSDMQRGHA